MEDPHTIVEYFAEHDRYRCGYCGQKDTNYSHVMWAHKMSAQDYQDLIDRGWRRSGKTVYKPTMKMMCCPHYTIRCRALDFKMNKSHKKQIKRVNRYLITGVKPGKDTEEDIEEESEGTKSQTANQKKDFTKEISTKTTASSQGQKDSTGGAGCSSSTGQDQSQKHIPRQGSGPDPSKPKCRKAKELRAERKAKKMSLEESSPAEKKPKQSQEKSLEELITEPDRAENPAHKLEVRLCRSAPVSPVFRESFKESYDVYRRYQMAVHKDAPEDCDIKGFQSFLMHSPLQEQHGTDIPDVGYGSFHQQYLLDGKIIAVGVVDILPTCMSSVYLYYDPDYSFLGLGVYTALREIMFVRELQRSAPDLQHYYMGFYIHSCPKMRYKGQFNPSDLACPESYQWVPVPKCLPKLDASAYARLSEDGAEDKNMNIDVNQVLVLSRGKVIPFGIYKMMGIPSSEDEQAVREYAGFVGKTCAERMYLVRH